MNTIRIGIVGFDHPHVLRFAPMLAAHRHASLTWIAEDGVNAGVARAMADRLGVPLVREPADDVDAVYIATRPSLHRGVVERLAPRGIHILCDKPIALTAEDGRAIVDVAGRAGIRLMVPFNPRGQDGPRAIKERIDRGELGELRLVHAVKVGKVPLTIPGIDASWLVDPTEGRFGGFGDIGLHAIDALRWLIGREPRRVYARIHRGVRPDLAVDSIGTATIEWDGGAVSTLTAGWANPDGFPTFLDARFEVVGSKGAARVDHPYQDLRVADASRSERLAAARTDAVWNLDSFIDAVRRDVEPPITGEDGLRALELLLACYRSSELGEEVAT
ncbi:MAG TPA: Gfo/Idh/MocA family oxidoreductase [Candidatus Limnocylindrales bacterium]|nr:Gfo/Idh/MocA family oxidoreductase [Candidatus Limnocylindrales bacterium]